MRPARTPVQPARSDAVKKPPCYTPALPSLGRSRGSFVFTTEESPPPDSPSGRAWSVTHPMDTLTDAVSRRRTFAIFSFFFANETAPTEKLLLFGGAINLAGAVKAR